MGPYKVTAFISKFKQFLAFICSWKQPTLAYSHIHLFTSHIPQPHEQLSVSPTGGAGMATEHQPTLAAIHAHLFAVLNCPPQEEQAACKECII